LKATTALLTGTLTITSAASGTPIQLTITDSSSTGRAAFSFGNDLGNIFAGEVTGSGFGLANTAFIFTQDTGAALASLTFATNAQLSAGGTTPIIFSAGGLSSQLLIQPSGAIQLRVPAGGNEGQIVGLSSNATGVVAVGNGTYNDFSGTVLATTLALGNTGGASLVKWFSGASYDTGISRLGAGIIGVGTGAAASTAGTLVATTLQLASTSGPTWTSGSAAPSSTPAYGSMYSCTAGGVGLTNLYVYTVAGWVGIV
jgi:hypothetical protein